MSDAAATTGRRESGLEGVVRLASCFGGAAVDLAPTLLTPRLLNPLTWTRLAADFAERGAAGVRLLPSNSAGTAFVEIDDKVEVFCLVREVGRLIGVPEQGTFPLQDLVARSYALGPFRALWSIEGLGHDYGIAWLDAEASPRGILREPRTGPLPASSLLMLHAGIGLAFAERRLQPFGARATQAELTPVIADVVELYRENSRPGYLGAAYESLGLVTRTFHGPLVAAVGRAVREVAPEVEGFYWHGVGRAIYFLPINFLPCSDWQVFATGLRETPDEEAQANAWAGAAWGFTLVCQRRPQVLAELLVAPYAQRLESRPGFANGVASAAVVRRATTPGAPFIETFGAFRPFAPGEPDAAAWERLVHAPYQAALDVYFPVLAAHDRLDEVFHYQDLPALVAEIERGGPR